MASWKAARLCSTRGSKKKGTAMQRPRYPMFTVVFVDSRGCRFRSRHGRGKRRTDTGSGESKALENVVDARWTRAARCLRAAGGARHGQAGAQRNVRRTCAQAGTRRDQRRGRSSRSNPTCPSSAIPQNVAIAPRSSLATPSPICAAWIPRSAAGDSRWWMDDGSSRIPRSVSPP